VLEVEPPDLFEVAEADAERAVPVELTPPLANR